MRFDAIIFDFDGVLLESEFEGNRHLAELLTELGHPTSVDEALSHFIGLSGGDFISAIERRIGATLPEKFHQLRAIEDERVLREGLREVSGAIEFVRSLPADLPIAVASSSSVRWVRSHLVHLGLGDRFGDHVYSGREHVERGKPAPDFIATPAHSWGCRWIAASSLKIRRWAPKGLSAREPMSSAWSPDRTASMGMASG